MALYSDRASWAFFTPQAGGQVDKHQLTQVGRALDRLGVEHIAAYTPQARGRSERMFRTLQDRLVSELRLEGIDTVQDANTYLRTHYLSEHNRRSACEARDSHSCFVRIPHLDLQDILCIEEERTVALDHTVRIRNQTFQLKKQAGMGSLSRTRVRVRIRLDGTLHIVKGERLLGSFPWDPQPNQHQAA